MAAQLVGDDYFPSTEPETNRLKALANATALQQNPVHMVTSMAVMLVVSMVDTIVFLIAHAIDNVSELIGQSEGQLFEMLVNASAMETVAGVVESQPICPPELNETMCATFLKQASAVATATTPQLDATQSSGSSEVLPAADSSFPAVPLGGGISPTRALISWLGIFGDGTDESESLVGELGITLMVLIVLVCLVWLRYRKYFDAFEDLLKSEEQRLVAAMNETQTGTHGSHDVEAEDDDVSTTSAGTRQTFSRQTTGFTETPPISPNKSRYTSAET